MTNPQLGSRSRTGTNPSPQLGSLEHIAIAAVRPSTTNPRRNFDQAALAELAASIRELGVTVPVLVRPMLTDGLIETYELVSGERRYRAAQLAGLEEIPATIKELTDAEAAEMQMVENLQRADLHPMEEAEGYQALFDTHYGWQEVGDTAEKAYIRVEDIAKIAGKTVAYVLQRLKLLTLGIPAKLLFTNSHITLGHALLLARLTEADQDKACREMLRASGDYSQMSTVLVIAAREKNIRTNSYAKNNRLIDTTEGTLRDWIRDNLLLDLAKAPWALDDAQLLPWVGPCTTCPKRSGSNAALFADITADQDKCLDAVCFGEKQKAFLLVTIKAAEKSGKPLVKLQAKSSHKPIAGPKAPGKLGHGQWLAAEPGSCKSVTQGLMVEEPPRFSDINAKPGDVVTICADQQCKVHKHTVCAPVAINASAASGGNAKANQEEARKAQELRRKIEERVLIEVYGEVRVKGALDVGGLMVRAACQLTDCVGGGYFDQMGYEDLFPLNGLKMPENYSIRDKVLRKSIEKMNTTQLYQILFDGCYGHLRSPDEDRDELWALAKKYKVDADAIEARIEAEMAEPEKKAEAKKTASKGVGVGSRVDGKSAGAGAAAEARA